MTYDRKNKKITNLLRLSSLTVVLTLAFALIGEQKDAHAASLANWDPGMIISNDVFTNKGAMSASQIQAFLQSKVPNCDTNGAQTSEYGGGTRAQWGTAHGYPPPYTCLKDYNEGGRSSSQIIYDTAQQYSINPQVLIVLLQKEQGLITDTWPLSNQYRTATGYGCPDTAACGTTYYGLTNQVNWAAKMFRAILNLSPTWYSPYVVGNNYIRWSPNSACGGSNVNIRNLATAALYNYTPYQPNQAALNAGYGSGDSCSAHGNRNFYLFFSDWFGSTVSSPNYNWSVSSQQSTYKSVTTTTNTINLYPGETAKIIVKAVNSGNQTWQQYNTFMGTTHSQDRSSVFFSGDWYSPSRAARVKESFVEPGATGTFEFTVTAPNALFSSREYFNILTEGTTWHTDIGLYYNINVVQPSGEYYNATFQSYNLYSDAARTKSIAGSYNNVIKGSTLYGAIAFKNVGNSTLDKSFTYLATNGPRDRTSAFQDVSWANPNRIAQMNENSVAPGANGTVNFTIKTPTTTGLYNETYGLVAEGRSWMDINKLSTNINVVNTPRIIMTTGSMIGGEKLTTESLRRNFIIQTDGNLVMYDNVRPVWATNTSGSTGPITLVLQTDGNLVLYGASNRVLWHSNTAGMGGNTLIFQNDGNLVLYRAGGVPVWATHTRQ